MRHVCHTSGFSGRRHGTDAVDHLNHDPEAENDNRGNVSDTTTREHPDPVSWEEDEISAQYAADSSRSADGRNAGARSEEDVSKRRRKATGQIEDEEANRAHYLLEVVSENPQIQHIAAEVHPPTV